MSEVSELSPPGNHSRMKPFQNKMSHNYRSSFKASLLRMAVAEGVEWRGNWHKTHDFYFFIFRTQKKKKMQAK